MGLRQIALAVAAAWTLTACVAGGGGGMGGAPEPEPADAGCEPAPGEYTGTWTIDDGGDDDCPQLEPTSSRFGDGADDDCADGCVCSRSVAREDGVCVGTLSEECTDGGQTTLVVCALAATAGAARFPGMCGLEITVDGVVGLDCRYSVDFERTGD